MAGGDIDAAVKERASSTWQRKTPRQKERKADAAQSTRLSLVEQQTTQPTAQKKKNRKGSRQRPKTPWAIFVSLFPLVF